MKRAAILYFLILAAAGLPILWLLHVGSTLPAPAGSPVVPASAAPAAAAGASAIALVAEGISKNSTDPLSHLFLQLVAIIAASRAVGWLFTRIGQPAVVGEMAAGILLGPSLFGLLAPASFAFVFPPASLGTLHLLSQVGVCLFMF